MSEAFWIVLRVIMIILDTCFFLVSVIGNAVVIFVINRDKKLKSKLSYHILSVACADMMVGLVAIPSSGASVLLGFPRHYKFCLYLSSFCTGVFIVSLFALLAVSIDRFWAVCYPLTYHVRDANLAKAGIAVCWIFGLALGSLPVLGWNSGQWDGLCDYRVITDLNYLLFMCALTFTPAMTIIVLYVLIYREIMNQAKKREAIEAHTSEFVNHRREAKAAKTLSMIVATYFFLWTPVIFCAVTIAVTENRQFPLDIFWFSSIFVHFNPAIDPVIYAYRMRNIRDGMRKLFNCIPAMSPNNSSSSTRTSRSDLKSKLSVRTATS